jgi:hypothetical protein
MKETCSDSVLNPSRVYRQIPVLARFLGNIFSTKNKQVIRSRIVQNNQENLNLSFSKYFNCANLIVSTKLLLKWEEETSKLLQHLHFALDSSSVQPLEQLTSLARSNQFFRLIGYGKLLDSLPFLEEIANEHKKHSGIAAVAEDLISNLQKIERLNFVCSPETFESDSPISPQSTIRFTTEAVILFQVIDFGHFDKSLLFPMQKVAISIFNQTNEEEEQNWINLFTELVYKIKELPNVKELKQNLMSSACQNKFVSDILYSEMDPHFYEMKVVDLEKCRHCEWRFRPRNS